MAFGVVDFLVFGVSLAVALGIGVFYAVLPRIRHRSAQTASDFVLGGRNLPLVPTALSLFASFISAISILSYPAEIYTMGTAFVWTGVGAILALLTTALFVIPVIYHVKSINIYEYLQERFESRLLRFIGSMCFVLNTLLYMSVVLYVPSIAMAGVSSLPLWAYIILVGVVCTIYTTLGGIKAVVWTDAFQTIVMFGGLTVLAVLGTLRANGWDNVWRIAKESHRLDGFSNLDPNPFQYMTVWTGIFGGWAYWLSGFSASQIALQRYCSLGSVRKAQMAALINIPCILIVFSLVFYTGLVMVAHYAGCDPIASKTIQSRDQLTMHYMLDILEELPGLPGLFMACVFSGTLSTVSSSINSIAAVVWNETSALLCCNNDDRVRRYSLAGNQALTFAFGLSALGLAFIVKPLGGALIALFQCISCFSGPVLGLVALGMFVPWAEKRGALAGLTCGIAINLWVTVGRIRLKPDPYYTIDGLTSCCNVTCGNATDFDWNSVPPVKHFEDVERFYALSSQMISLLGCVVTLLVGTVASLAIRKGDVRQTCPPECVYWSMIHMQAVRQ